jgi:hypothetical protein
MSCLAHRSIAVVLVPVFLGSACALAAHVTPPSDQDTVKPPPPSQPMKREPMMGEMKKDGMMKDDVGAGAKRWDEKMKAMSEKEKTK